MRCAARRSRAAATISIARVIFWTFLTEAIRCLTSFWAMAAPGAGGPVGAAPPPPRAAPPPPPRAPTAAGRPPAAVARAAVGAVAVAVGAVPGGAAAAARRRRVLGVVGQ